MLRKFYTADSTLLREIKNSVDIICFWLFSLWRLSCVCALEMPGNAPSCVVRPFYVHSKEIKQTNEQRHPKLNRRDDIVTCRHGTLLDTPQLATKYCCFNIMVYPENWGILWSETLAHSVTFTLSLMLVSWKPPSQRPTLISSHLSRGLFEQF